LAVDATCRQGHKGTEPVDRENSDFAP
jgi:hypothetical protein